MPSTKVPVALEEAWYEQESPRREGTYFPAPVLQPLGPSPALSPLPCPAGGGWRNQQQNGITKAKPPGLSQRMLLETRRFCEEKSPSRSGQWEVLYCLWSALGLEGSKCVSGGMHSTPQLEWEGLVLKMLLRSKSSTGDRWEIALKY